MSEPAPDLPKMHPRLMIAELEEHPLRQRLNNEFHARPPIPLVGAMLVSHLVFKHSATTVQAAVSYTHLTLPTNREV